MGWKCLDHDDRVRLDALVRAGHSKREMAAVLGVHISTIYRELRRGACRQRDSEWREYTTYSYQVADDDARRKRANCGAPLKLGGNVALADYVRHRICDDRYSPAAVSAELRHLDLGYLCEDTIYRYIRRRLIPGLRPSHLPERGIRKHPAVAPERRRRAPAGTSIEQRPSFISDRSSFGHWEMDCVIGRSAGTDQALLVLTERLTRAELCFKLPRKDSASVVAVLDDLSRRCSFRKIFRSITMDNGSEFSAADRLEHWPSGRRRTNCYYCHPYCSSERGSNENANRLIRRWFKKGVSLSAVTNADCLAVARWMNNYPRQLLGWQTASQCFRDACFSEGIKISPWLSQFFS